MATKSTHPDHFNATDRNSCVGMLTMNVQVKVTYRLRKCESTRLEAPPIEIEQTTNVTDCTSCVRMQTMQETVKSNLHAEKSE